MSDHAAPMADEEVLKGAHTLASVGDELGGLILAPRSRSLWWMGLFAAFGLLNLFLVAVTWLLIRGVGIWGIDVPVAWGFAITNFVWWIGIGHAGTFISAILYLLHQEWRTSINRFAEAMTLFAVACAGMYPLLHLGRPWFFYWLLPYPDTMDLWPQVRSPLVWDVFAVSTYALISLVFWYIGLIPDVAALRDRAQARGAKLAYGIAALGWRGSVAHWRRYQTAYLILAGLATPLVISVHSVVSLDFSVAIVPGWHSTIFPPYFVAGAIFSGFAMVLTLGIPLRKFYHLENYITEHHLENCSRLLLLTGQIVTYGYVMEFFSAWYSDAKPEAYMAWDRATGMYWPGFACMMAFNVLLPNLLWFRKVRRSPYWLFPISLCVNVGMWAERYIIVVQSLHRDYLPSSWGTYAGTRWDWLTYLGSFGLFFFFFLLFCRWLPVISITEMRELVQKKNREAA